MKYKNLKGTSEIDLPSFCYGKTKIGVCAAVDEHTEYGANNILASEYIPYLYFRTFNVADLAGAEMHLPIYTDEIEKLGMYLISLASTLKDLQEKSKNGR